MYVNVVTVMCGCVLVRVVNWRRVGWCGLDACSVMFRVFDVRCVVTWVWVF